MAIKAISSYADAQNGNHQVLALPDNLFNKALTPEGIEVQSSPVVQARPAKVASRSMSVGALAEELKAQSKHLAGSTQKVREAYLNVLLAEIKTDTEVSNVTPSLLRKVRGAISEGRKPTTVNDIMNKALRPLLALAVELGFLEKSPLESIKALKKEKPIRLQPTWDQAQAIIDHVQKSSRDSATLLRFILFFGVGQAEIKGVRLEHVDSANQCIHFFRQKTKKEYVVPIFPHAQEFIKTLMANTQVVIGTPIFEWHNPRKALESACGKLKVPLYSPRAFRRTFIIQCLEKGVDPRVVASWQGHADARLILTTYGSFISADHAKIQAAKMS